jgi:prepilin-type N-terminal cleavage/methylation domain-containing protein
MKNSKGFSLLELLIVVAIILIIATIAIPSLLRSRQAANESAAVANLRTVNTAQVTYLSSYGSTFGTLANLIGAKLLDDTFTGTKAGYLYAIELDPTTFQDYTASATPASPNTGRYGYYSVPDAVVRYSSVSGLAPAGQEGRSVQ